MKHLFFCALVATLLAGCQSDSPKQEQAAFTIRINPLPPSDLPPEASPAALATFAWEEFFALNWKAVYDSKNQYRDSADTKWSFRERGTPALLVWETYAHRTELRPYYDPAHMRPLKPFNSPPQYLYKVRPLPMNPGDSDKLFDNLDENSEIGSCDVYGKITSPDSSTQRRVLYQAKVNSEEYNYIRRNFPNNDSLLAATTRTAFNISTQDRYYTPSKTKNYQGTCYCPPGVICLPCGENATAPGKRAKVGSIEVKTAWRQLAFGENPSLFLTRRVIYYTIKVKKNKSGKVGRGDTTFYYNNGTFALIGIHIIHKTQNYPAFVFATWEHNGVENDAMGLREIDSKADSTRPPHPYQRGQPISEIAKQATAAAHAALRRQNPSSVWLNYHLVGVQGTPTSDSTSTKTDFFLANYVIESDRTLKDFHGSGIGLPHNFGSNVLYKSKRLAMGGCQGCHGVGQLNSGTDFSFLLDSFEKPVLMPDIDGERVSAAQRAKLLRYIRASTKR